MLRLRPYKPCDAATIVTWITNEQLFFWWSAGLMGDYPLTAERLNAHYDKQADNDGFFVMSAYDETGLVGQLIMRFLDEEKKDLRLGFIIVDGAKRGHGYGKEMVSLAIRYGFEFLKVKRVSLGVFEDNAAAYHCYEAAGLRKSGKPETYTIQGKEWKCFEMEIMEE